MENPSTKKVIGTHEGKLSNEARARRVIKNANWRRNRENRRAQNDQRQQKQGR